MNPWWWVLIIASGIVLALVVLLFVLPMLFAVLLDVKKWVRHRRYARQARRHNKKARLLRLAKTEWNSFPLPTGKEGTLRISYDQLVMNHNRFSQSQMDRVYSDRGRDLKVDLELTNDRTAREFIIRWWPHKGRWPKERY